jgi:hypothetical protein
MPPIRVDDKATAIVTNAPDDAASSHPYGLGSATNPRTTPRWKRSTGGTATPTTVNDALAVVT